MDLVLKAVKWKHGGVDEKWEDVVFTESHDTL